MMNTGTRLTCLGMMLSFGQFMTGANAWKKVQSACSVCPGTNDIPAENEWREVLNGQSCRQYGWAATFTDETDDVCYTHYNLIGFCFCGCSPPPSAKPNCSLCMDGSEPPNADAFIDGSNIYTCQRIHDYLLGFEQSEGSCNTFQEKGIKNCGCPIITESPTRTPTSVTDVPSQSPSSVLERNPDCEALKAGKFPQFNNPKLRTTEISLNLGVVLSDETELTSVNERLQRVMSAFVSASAAGCFDRRRLQIQRNLRDSRIHYVEFSDLSKSSEDACETTLDDANCVMSEVEVSVHHSPKGGLVSTQLDDFFFQEVNRILGNEAADIAEEVDGVLELQTMPTVVTPRDGPDEANIAIGVGAGSVALLALCTGICLFKKGQALKRDLEIDEFSKVEFLPNKTIRSDQQGVAGNGDLQNSVSDEFEETDSADLGSFTSNHAGNVVEANDTDIEVRLDSRYSMEGSYRSNSYGNSSQHSSEESYKSNSLGNEEFLGGSYEDEISSEEGSESSPTDERYGSLTFVRTHSQSNTVEI